MENEAMSAKYELLSAQYPQDYHLTWKRKLTGIRDDGPLKNEKVHPSPHTAACQDMASFVCKMFIFSKCIG